MSVDHSAHPRLTHLKVRFSPDCELELLDPDAGPESVVHRWRDDAALAEFRAEVRETLAVMSTLTEDEARGYLGLHCSLPAGGTVAGWLAYLAEHLTEFYPHRSPQTITVDGTLPQRASRFIDQETANDAATEVLRLHEPTVRRWSADPTGADPSGSDPTGSDPTASEALAPARLHLYADLGRPLGHYLEASQVQAYRWSRDGTAPEPTRYPATGCVVVLRRQPANGRPYIATAYPERVLPVDVRDRFPDLTLLFGGYFGQDYPGLDVSRWAAERAFNTETPAPVRARVVAQLDQLLEADDETLRADVDALGSYVLPTAVRRWVTGLRRRATRLDWTGP